MMENQINEILNAMCIPGPISLNAGDFQFLDSCSGYSMQEYCADNIRSAMGNIKAHDLNGVKNVAITIGINEHEKTFTLGEIGGLRDVCSRLDKSVNVMWGVNYSDVRSGQRKIKVLLAR